MQKEPECIGTAWTLLPNRLMTPRPSITGGGEITKAELTPPRPSLRSWSNTGESAGTADNAWTWPYETFSRTGSEACSPLVSPDKAALSAATTAATDACGLFTARRTTAGKSEMRTPPSASTSVSLGPGSGAAVPFWWSSELSRSSSLFSSSSSSSSSSSCLDFRPIWGSPRRRLFHLPRLSAAKIRRKMRIQHTKLDVCRFTDRTACLSAD